MVDSRLSELRDRFQRLGLPEAQAESAAQYEVDSNAPALATQTLLTLCWHRLINQYDRPGALRGLPAAHRLADAGAKLEDLRLLARGAAFETLFGLFYLLSEGPNHALREALGIVNGGYPGWSLIEVDSDHRPTGRWLDGVYEGLRTTDPSGREARDFLDD
jgi:hypothetical protein